MSHLYIVRLMCYDKNNQYLARHLMASALHYIIKHQWMAGLLNEAQP